MHELRHALASPCCEMLHILVAFWLPGNSFLNKSMSGGEGSFMAVGSGGWWVSATIFVALLTVWECRIHSGLLPIV